MSQAAKFILLVPLPADVTAPNGGNYRLQINHEPASGKSRLMAVNMELGALGLYSGWLVSSANDDAALLAKVTREGISLAPEQGAFALLSKMVREGKAQIISDP